MLLAIATFAESPISAFPVTHNNVIVTGISATITEENVTTAADANTFPTGEILTVNEGDVSVDLNTPVDLTGQQLSVVNSTLISVQDTLNAFAETPFATQNPRFVLTASNVTIIADANVNITGIDLSANLGDEIVQADANVFPTGIDLVTNLGDEIVQADANVFPTGTILTSNEGDVSVDLNTPVDLTGQELSSNVNSVSVSANADVQITGQQLTVSLNNPLITAWSNVDPNVTNTWTEVDTEDTNTWREVDIAA
jgi:FKBP-type peptidyl-prolyl cis-trans isomerase 2